MYSSSCGFLFQVDTFCGKKSFFGCVKEMMLVGTCVSATGTVTEYGHTNSTYNISKANLIDYI